MDFLARIDQLEIQIGQLHNHKTLLIHQYLEKNGWTIEKLSDIGDYLYKKDDYITICPDHALEHDIDP